MPYRVNTSYLYLKLSQPFKVIEVVTKDRLTDIWVQPIHIMFCCSKLGLVPTLKIKTK